MLTAAADCCVFTGVFTGVCRRFMLVMLLTARIIPKRPNILYNSIIVVDYLYSNITRSSPLQTVWYTCCLYYDININSRILYIISMISIVYKHGFYGS